MMCRAYPLTRDPHEALGEALGRTVPRSDGEAVPTVVAHWPGLDTYTMDGEQRAWPDALWAEHLEDPYLEHRFTVSQHGDQHAIFRLEVRLHPDDRELSLPDWKRVADYLAHVAGVNAAGDSGCRWVALQSRPRRLDLIANLISHDGVWQTEPANLDQQLWNAARVIERDLVLTPPMPLRPPYDDIAGLASETSQLGNVRRYIEHTALHLAHQPDGSGPATAQRLRHIARRIQGIQQELHSVATTPPELRLGAVAPAPPAAGAASRRSP